MEKRTKAILTGVKEYLLIALGLFIYSIGWTLFLIPNGLVGGGITGVSAILYYLTGFPVSYSYFIINILLLIIAVMILGKGFGIKTIFAITVVSFFLKFLPGAIPPELIQDIAIGNGKLLSALIGGVAVGVGIALTFTQGGSSGGTDIIALIINKYRNISPGKLILLMDIIIVGCSLLVPTEGSFGSRVATVVYGFIQISVVSYSIDLVLSGARQSIQIFIFSKNHEVIADRITSMGRGVTVINALGWFTKREGKVLMVIVRRTEINFIFKIVRETDRNAFLSVGNVMGVYGEGFDEMKR